KREGYAHVLQQCLAIRILASPPLGSRRIPPLDAPILPSRIEDAFASQTQISRPEGPTDGITPSALLSVNGRAVRRLPDRQAAAGRGCRRHPLDGPVATLPGRRRVRETHGRRSGLLPPEARWPARPGVRLLQVPLDGRGRRGAQGRPDQTE